MVKPSLLRRFWERTKATETILGLLERFPLWGWVLGIISSAATAVWAFAMEQPMLVTVFLGSFSAAVLALCVWAYRDRHDARPKTDLPRRQECPLDQDKLRAGHFEQHWIKDFSLLWRVAPEFVENYSDYIIDELDAEDLCGLARGPYCRYCGRDITDCWYLERCLGCSKDPGISFEDGSWIPEHAGAKEMNEHLLVHRAGVLKKAQAALIRGEGLPTQPVFDTVDYLHE